MSELQSNNTVTYWVYRDNYPVYRHSQPWAANAKASKIAEDYPSSEIVVKMIEHREIVLSTIVARTPYPAKKYVNA